jgi:hypothetical protein
VAVDSAARQGYPEIAHSWRTMRRAFDLRNVTDLRLKPLGRRGTQVNLRKPYSLTALCVWLLATVAAACGQDKLIPRPPPGLHDDEFNQAGNRLIDVLWVIDNSCSMANKQDQVANSFLNFISYFARGNIDYRIGVTTTDIYTDQGQLLGCPPIITPPPQTPDPVTAFQANVHVGTGGNGDTRGLSAMQEALDAQNLIAQNILTQQSQCAAACNASDQICQTNCVNQFSPQFMRPGAYLEVIVVTSSADDSFPGISPKSGDAATNWQRYLAHVKGCAGDPETDTNCNAGNSAAVTFSAILGEPPQPPASCGAVVDELDLEVAQLTNGVIGSICDSDFSTTLTNLAYNAAGLQRSFPLTATPDVSTITVLVHYQCDANPLDIETPCENQVNTCPDAGSVEAYGITCGVPANNTDGWTYEAATNTIFFNGASIPGIRSQVEIKYSSVDAATGG